MEFLGDNNTMMFFGGFSNIITFFVFCPISLRETFDISFVFVVKGLYLFNTSFYSVEAIL